MLGEQRASSMQMLVHKLECVHRRCLATGFESLIIRVVGRALCIKHPHDIARSGERIVDVLGERAGLLVRRASREVMRPY